MFEGFARVWTPVEVAGRLGSKPLAVRVAGEDVVLFRGAGGRAAALVDRCPHRGVALSLGRVGQDGCIECPFHGWRFDGAGACREIPLSDVPPEKRGRHAATALPVRELGGLLWLFTGPDAEGEGEPHVPDGLLDPRLSRSVHAQDWSTHWTRAMENMLDFPHLPFVHRSTIGRDMRRALRPGSVMHVDTAETPSGMQVHAWLDDQEQKGVRLDWVRPNGMVLRINIPGRDLRIHVFCTPIDAARTRMLLITTRDFGRYNPLMRLSALFNRRILLEDRAVVESSRPAEVPEAHEEVSVATDRATLVFRRYYHRELRGSRADRPPTGHLQAASAPPEGRLDGVVPAASLARRKKDAIHTA
ncbi:aromatic ring-hydroxylating dioxygenase subunit alpha [Sorangium sp. So ce321]|uniref:Rieske 2Fe-2S domain-containing protein n=1 Tax=Sorangium sp. So ce321 TaxID=3133300 RepID=UPI003F6339A6